MTRGTTPVISLRLPFSADALSDFYITFSQNRTVLFEKTKNDCEIEDNIIKFRLTQEDTLRLKSDITVEFQIRAVAVSGDRIASDIMQTTANRILKDGEI